MKKCLLVGINAKYIHTNLAIRYLNAYSKKHYSNVQIKEFSINDNVSSILQELYSSTSDIYAFSCYIWNIDMVLKLCSSLKKIKPSAVFILGGPEVSFDSETILKQYKFVDYIIRNEGEETLLELLHHLQESDTDLSSIKGISYRIEGNSISNEERPLLNNLDVIPFPYEDLDQLNNKIIYYETSRGCPFNCQYCLSSTIHGVRFFSMDRIKKDIKLFVENQVKQVKLVDRTFNCNKKHSMEIIKYVMELNGKTNFHFEIAADLLDQEMIDLLAAAPQHMFQFEIGVQSTNQQSLKEISRAMNLDKVKHNVLALQKAGNSHMHLDLIAGLPYEDFYSFKNSFDEIHSLLPDMLQLGFLKLLKGSGIRERANEYEIAYNDFNPYEILSSKWISFEELTTLKEIEHLLELYYNSGRFKNSLNYLFQKHYPSFFDFYLEFSKYWHSKALFDASQSTRELYNILWAFAEEQKLMTIALNELIKLDWLLYFNNGNMPERIQRYPHGSVKHALQEFIKGNEALIGELFPNEKTDHRQLQKNVLYEVFYTDVLNHPEVDAEYAVFFTKDKTGNLKLFHAKLSDILQS